MGSPELCERVVPGGRRDIVAIGAQPPERGTGVGLQRPLQCRRTPGAMAGTYHGVRAILSRVWRRRAHGGGTMATADLVLEGGGVKGIGLVGAISVLEEHGYEFHRVAGTSAGAIVGALVASQIAAPDLQKIMWAVDYNKFQDASIFGRLGPLGKGIEILFHDGIYQG